MLRRRGPAALAALTLMVALGGCADPAGDGDLVDDWALIADATWNVPPAGTCYDSANIRADLVSVTLPVERCDRAHTVETFHVGEVPSEVATATTVPEPKQPAYQRVHAECEKAAKEFLGDDPWLGRVYLRAVLPQTYQWAAGARFYRCDLMETKSQDDMVVERTASLRDGLRGARPAASTCYVMDKPADVESSELSPVDCAQPHHAEFAGVFDPPGTEPLPAGDARDDQGFDGCLPVVRRYVGVTGGLKVDYMYWGYSTLDWNRGDRRVRCYALTPDEAKRLQGSVKGIGDAAPTVV